MRGKVWQHSGGRGEDGDLRSPPGERLKSARLVLGAASLLILSTAAFHASGGATISDWLEGDRGTILRLLWYAPALDWTVIGLLWLFVAWRGDRRLAPIVWISALIPLAIAIMLVRAVGTGFPGFWMLLGAAILSIAGSLLLRRTV